MSTESGCPVRLEDAPVGKSRTEAWKYLRSAGDVFENEGIWHFISAEAVKFALQNPKLFSNQFGDTTSGAVVPGIPNGIDPPEHVRYRRVIDPMFAPRVVKEMEPGLRRQVNELIDAFIETGKCDIIADLGNLFPTQVFLTMFGLPLEDREKIVGWVLAHYGSANAERVIALYHGRTDEAVVPDDQDPGKLLTDYLRVKIQEKRANPGDDIISKVIAVASTGEKPWTDDELLGFAVLVTQAGLDTVTNSIGFMMYQLANQPDLRRSLLADPDLIGPAIEEMLRLEMVAPFVARVTTQDVEVCGKQIPGGSLVWICFASANRDPDVYSVPDEFNLTETRAEHFSFGAGIHRCLGSHLARQEMRIVFEEFHRRIPEYQLAEGADPTVHWPALIVGLDEVPLVFPPGEAGR